MTSLRGDVLFHPLAAHVCHISFVKLARSSATRYHDGTVSRVQDLFANELMRMVVSIRVDTVWRMLKLLEEGRLPSANAEGATGRLDNKGAIFIPGGLVFDDSDRKPIKRERAGAITARQFRMRIQAALQHDNATLIFPDGVVHGVNLDNGFFASIASSILANKHAALMRRPRFKPNPMARIDSDQITRSHTPTYVSMPYGSRTRLSSCVAVCLLETRMYYVACRKEFGLRSQQEEQTLWNNIRDARRPVSGRQGESLAAPCVVVCHTTRYLERNLCGITRILGYGRFGEFACLTFERVTAALLAECNQTDKVLPPKYELATLNGVRTAAVLRTYGASKPGRRQKKTDAQLISLVEDLGIDIKPIEREARERYHLQ